MADQKYVFLRSQKDDKVDPVAFSVSLLEDDHVYHLLVLEVEIQ